MDATTSTPDGAAPGSWDLTPASPPPRPASRPGGAPVAGLPPSLLGRYEVLGELGRGAMGVVLRARDRQANRDVALKLAPRAAASDPRGERARERFRREGQLTAALRHPGIVAVHSAGEADGVPYLAYELVEGCRTLDEVLPRLPLRARVALVRDVARALGHAHARGVIHRDVKPGNVLVDAHGRAKVADFGLASASGLERLTVTGALIGTPLFMAPEQVGGARDAHGPPTDVWALGVLLYQALADALPFEAESLGDLTARIMAGKYRPLGAEAPRPLAHVVARALRVDPRERHPDGEAFARDLDAWLDHGGASSATRAWLLGRSLRPAAVALGAALTIGVGVIVGARMSATTEAVVAPPLVVTLDGPPEDHETFDASVEVRGRAPGATAVLVRAGGAVLRGAVREGAFSLRVPLLPGTTELEVEVTGEAGAAPALARRRVRRLDVPAWFQALPASARPPLPLPPGLAFGEERGRYVNLKDGSLLVWVPGGTYTIGSRDMHTGQVLPEQRREVQGFFMGVYEVTWGQYRRFCAETGRAVHDARLGFTPRDDHPVQAVTWDDAVAYCEWAGLRLPTELEWEVAARGPRGEEFPWGPLPEDGPPPANLEGDADGFPTIAPVGSFPDGASPFGCLDMAGNVWEYTADPFDLQPGEERRAMRGGGYGQHVWYARTTFRDGALVDVRWAGIGFRACRSAGP